MLEMTFDIEPDEHGVFDGRELARQLIRSAYCYLTPYVDACPACADNLFSVIANEVIEELHQVGRKEGQLRGGLFTNHSDLSSRTAAQKAHMEAAEGETRRLLGNTTHEH